MSQFLKNKKKAVLCIVMIALAWIGTYGINYICSLVCGYLFPFSIFSVAVFAALFVLLKYTWENISKIADRASKRHRLIYSFLTALLFSVLLIIGYQLKATGMTECGFLGKGLIFLRGLCLTVSVFPFSNYLFFLLEKIGGEYWEKKSAKVWKNRNVFFLGCVIPFLCWIPVFLAYYPAVMAYDFHRQSQEAVRGFIWFNSYQPLAHTWLIWLFLRIGTLFGSYQIGMAFYSLFQMLVLAVACGYSCMTVYRLLKKKWPVILMILFFGLFPFISILSVCVTKDIIFSALFLIFMSLFIDRHFLSDEKKQKWMDVIWVLEGILMILFRNNAIYAVAVFAVFYLIMGVIKQRLRILILCILLVVGGKGALEGLQFALGTTIRGSKLEMYNVPIQQMARVGYYHGDTMDEDTYELLNTYIPEKYWSTYNPPLGDTVRWPLGNDIYDTVWKGHMGEVLSAWAKIGMKYPNEYIDAFLVLNAGYWFLDDITWAEVFGSGLENRMGALSTYTSSTSEVIPEGIAHETKFPALENILENIVSANCFYQWPILSTLFKTATYCWMLLLTLIGCMYIKSRKKTLTVLLPTIYLATMFLGPVVQLRYVLPVIMIMPMMFALLVYKETKNPEVPEAEAEKTDM